MFIIGAGRFRQHLQQRGLLMKKLMIIGGIAAAVLVAAGVLTSLPAQADSSRQNTARIAAALIRIRFISRTRSFFSLLPLGAAALRTRRPRPRPCAAASSHQRSKVLGTMAPIPSISNPSQINLSVLPPRSMLR